MHAILVVDSTNFLTFAIELSSRKYLDKQMPAEETSVAFRSFIEIFSDYALDILGSWIDISFRGLQFYLAIFFQANRIIHFRTNS
jgi:hypothetical protein